MKQLSGTEKQELEAKIQVEQERQQELQEMNLNTSEESKIATVATRFISSSLWKYGVIVFLLCLFAHNVFHLLKFRNFGYDQYGLPIIILMLLFNHIACYITTNGQKSVVMKTVAGVWTVLVFVYLFWILP